MRSPDIPNGLLAASFALLLAASIGGGCGSSSEVERYRLTGAVTIDGHPVEAGEMVLEPDTSRGNSGPGVMATIEDGQFDTGAGQGTVGGPHIARILAGNGKNVSMMYPHGDPYSPKEFRISIELPREDAAHEFILSR